MAQIIYSLLIVSGIAAVLAVLLEIAHSFIADYGDVHVLINDEKDVEVAGGRPLLFTLMDEGIFIPSACGGRGTCSYCKVKVLEGGGPVLPTEKPFLDQNELTGNVRLSCQVKVRNDIKIEIPEELFLVKEMKAKITKMETLTPAIRGVRLDLVQGGEEFSFKPGQYVQLQAPKYELTKEPDFRAFSLASSPGDPAHIQLMITKAPEGMVSIYVHDYLNVGDEVFIRGPFGDFFYHDSDRGILMIATGSGLAPIKSILHYMLEHGIKRPTRLFFGANTRDDLLYHEWLQELENSALNFKYFPILSKPDPQDEWEGETGLITALVEKYVEQNERIDGYICGSPLVVNFCEKALIAKGVPKESIYYDAFA